MKVLLLAAGISILNQRESAEISTLKKFQEQFGEISEDDLCVIFCTDTEEGKKALKLLSQALREQFPFTVEIYVIEGLSVNIDNLRFLKVVREFTGVVSGIINDLPEDAEVYVINTTGHKIISSLLTVIGLLHNFKVLYLYKDSDKILLFPDIRIKLDSSIWFENYLLFKSIIFNKLPPSVIEKFYKVKEIPFHLKPFIFVKSGHLSLTSLGNLLKKQVLVEYSDEKLAIPFVWKRKFIEDSFLKNIDHSKPVFVLILDLDHFKQLNDTYGHLIGDKVLGSFVNVVLEILSEYNTLKCAFPPELIRWGGEEFLVVGQIDDESEVAVLAEKIRKKVENVVVPIEDVEKNITVSIGGVVGRIMKNRHQDFNSLLKTADGCLYKAKEKRNTVYIEIQKEK